MAQLYKKTGTCSRPSGAQVKYPMYLWVGESAGSMVASSAYPTAHSDTYVKATSKLNTSYWPYYATDPSKLLTGNAGGAAWMTAYPTVTNQRFHIDLGSATVIERIYYENFHSSGSYVDYGAKNFTLWGSNSADSFAELTYGTDTGWTQIGGALQFEQHTASNVADPKYIVVSNTAAYRYYALKIADNWGGTNLGLRHIELQENLVDVHCDAHCKTNFGDIRFHNAADAALAYMIDWPTLTGTTPNQSVGVWVATNPGTSATDVVLKYGDSALTDASDGTAVFSKYKGFEAGDDGTAISTADEDWTTVSGTAEIDTAQKYSGAKSLKLVGGVTQVDINIALAASNDYAVRFWFRKTNGAGYVYPFIWGNGTKRMTIICDSSENIKYRNSVGTVIDTGVNCAVDTWELFEARNIDFSAYTYDIYHNNICIASGAQMNADTAAVSTDHIRIVNTATSAGNDAWIDDLIVRKYAYPEPTWGTWGAEEEIEPEAVTETTSLDGLLQKSFTATTTLDGLLQDTVSTTTSLDAYLPDTATSTVSLDGMLQESSSAIISLDSLLENTVFAAVSLDSLLENTVSTTVSLDGLLQSSGSVSTSLDGQLVDSVSATASIDGILQKSLSASTSLDSLLEDTVSATASLDSLLQDTNSATASLDGELQSSSSASISIDGMLSSSNQATTGLDAVLSDSATVVILSFDSLLQDTNTATASLDAQVTSTLDETTGLDGILQAVITTAASIDAVLWGNPSLTVSLDSLLEGTVSATTSLDSMFASSSSASTSLDAALQDTNIATVSLDAALLECATITTGLDAVVIAAIMSETTSLDALLEGIETATTSLDSLLESSTASTASLDACLSSSTVSTSGLDATVYKPQIWSQEGDLFTSTATNAAAFGASVSISADAKVLAVGDSDAKISTYYVGHVEIFDNIEGVWTLRGDPVLPAGITTQNCRFGCAVSLSEYGDTLAVGAYAYNGTYSAQGCVYVYDYDGESWIQRGDIITSPNAAASKRFGVSVFLTLDKQTLYVGEKRYSTPETYAGIVYVYTWNATTETWDYDSYIQPDTPLYYDEFGASISKSGNKLAISAVGYYEYDSAGAVYIFEENEGVYTQHSIVTPLDANTDNEFGTCVTLAQEGELLVVGATWYTYADDSNTGCIYTFKWNGSSYIEYCPKEIPVAAGAWEMIGYSVAMTEDGNTLVSGAIGNSPGGIYFYDNIEEVADSYPNFYIDKSSTDLDIASESSGGIVYQQAIAESFFLWTMSYPAWSIAVTSTTDLVSTLTSDLGVSVYSYLTCTDTLSSKWTGSISVLEALALTSTAEDVRYLLDSITSTYDLSDAEVITFEHALTEWLDIKSTLTNDAKMFFELLSTADLSSSIADIWHAEITSALDISSLTQYDIVEALESIAALDDATLINLYATLTDSIELSSETRIAFILSVLSEIGFTSLASFINSPQEAILSELEMADTLEANGVFNHSLASSVLLTEEAQAALSLLVTSVLALTSSAALKQWLVEQVTSAAVLASNTSVLQSMYPSLESTLTITETLLANGAYYETVQSALQLSVSIELDGDVYECWVLNSPKFLPSIYTDYDFNSYCTCENRAFAANATGVYELAGNADDVQASVVLSETDFEVSGHKRFRKAYLGISGTSPVLIMETDGQRKVYSIASDGKVNASRELLGKYWKLSVVDFDTIEYISLIPVVLSRGK